MTIIISPSILSADFARLGEEVKAVLAAGADWIHFDVMDNHYVPNLTIGPLVCEALRKAGIKAPIDVHLMVSPVDAMVTDFAKAGATNISFHPEATQHVDRTIQHIRDSGCKPGLVFNPATSLNWLDYVIDKIDLSAIDSSTRPKKGRKSVEKEPKAPEAAAEQAPVVQVDTAAATPPTQEQEEEKTAPVTGQATEEPQAEEDESHRGEPAGDAGPLQEAAGQVVIRERVAFNRQNGKASYSNSLTFLG